MSKLHQALTDLGLDVALGTLKAYSVRYKWQERSELVDGAHTAVELANVPREMDERQARLGITMQELAREKLEVIDPYRHALSVRDAIALLRVGVDVERLAQGQATTRAELTVQMLDSLIRELVALFAEVNVIDDPATRATVWATKSDGILDVYAPPELLSKNR